MSLTHIDEGVFLYNGRQVTFVNVVNPKVICINGSVVFDHSCEYAVTYLPKRGYVENIATGERYQYFFPDNNNKGAHIPFKKAKIDSSVKGAISPSIKLNDEQLKTVNAFKSLAEQRTMYNAFLDQNIYEKIEEWIKLNCGRQRN